MNHINTVEPRDSWLLYPATILAPLKPGKSALVNYRVGYAYNGGTIHDHKWYAGYKVPPPVVPLNHVLRDAGIGLQLNAHPPYATALLVNLEKP